MRKTTKPNKTSQQTLFRKAARELGADESEDRFNAALKKIAKQKPKRSKIDNHKD